MSDLIVLVPDADMRETVKTLIEQRHRSLNIRAGVNFEINTHSQRDAGCYQDAHNFLRPFAKTKQYAMVLFDYHGCGRDSNMSAEDIQDELEKRLIQNGWKAENICVIVISPELESWVWASSTKVAEILGWKVEETSLRDWLINETKHWGSSDLQKPQNPKEALQAALRKARKPFSPTVFKDLAERISLKHCTDPSFERFRTSLQRWFTT